MNIDRELFDEENSYMQNQDKWENFGTQNGIEDDGYDHHSLHGAPRHLDSGREPDTQGVFRHRVSAENHRGTCRGQPFY